MAKVAKKSKVATEISTAVLIEPESESMIKPETELIIEPETELIEPAEIIKPEIIKQALIESELIEPELVEPTIKVNGIINDEPITFQKLEEKAQKAQEALEKEEKLRKDLEALNSKLLAEKTALLDSLSGEKGALSDYQEKCAKLTAQKNDLDNQLRVSWNIISDLKISPRYDELLMI